MRRNKNVTRQTTQRPAFEIIPARQSSTKNIRATTIQNQYHISGLTNNADIDAKTYKNGQKTLCLFVESREVEETIATYRDNIVLNHP